MTDIQNEYSVLDRERMARALFLAAQPRNACDPNPRVGCVIDLRGDIVGEGWHRRAGTAHAEVNALNAAGDRARGATAYVTLEPCNHHGRTGPCTDRLIDAGVQRVVCATSDPNTDAGGGIQTLRDAGVVVVCGLMTAQAVDLNRGFLCRHAKQRPFLTSKIAASLDGRTALADGHSKWITSAESRADVQQLRARVSAIMTGIGTVLADDPRLTVRLEPDETWQMPARVVLDGMLRTPPDARLLEADGEVLIIGSGHASADSERALVASGARVERISATDGQLRLDEVMSLLARYEFNEVLVEAGPTLNGSLLAAGLLDEVVVYQAPVVLGPDARPMFSLPPLRSMDDRTTLETLSARRTGMDWRQRLRVRSV